MNSRIQNIRDKKKRQQRTRMLIIFGSVLIIVALFVFLWPKDKDPGDVTVPEPHVAPTEVMAQVEDYSQDILGLWATKEGYYAEFKKKGQLLTGMSLSEMSKNTYSLEGNKISITFTEGDGAEATVSIKKGEKAEEDTLFVKFEKSTVKFNRHK